MRTVIISKGCILKMKREDMETIIFHKEGCFNLSLTLCQLKSQKLSYQMDQCILVSKSMAVDRAQVKQHIWMEVFMMANGDKTKSMEWVSFSILIKLSTTDNGKEM